MSIFEIIGILLTVAALGGYVNHRYIRLPDTIGHMAFALLLSIAAVALQAIGLIDLAGAGAFLQQIDFAAVLLHGMLSLMLFAGALHINLSELKSLKWPIAALASFGVALATFMIGTLVWYAARLLGIELPYIYALVFGALISPTDPIAVLSILKQAKTSKRLYTLVGGESLFNDGVGVVVFLSLLSVALTQAGMAPAHGNPLVLFVREALGGAVLGMLLGYGAYHLLKSIDNYKVEAMITLALAIGGYALAEGLHVSAPIAIVVAGLITGNQGRESGMSDITRARLDDFWELIDEILNAVLFMLIGLEIMIIPLSWPVILLGCMAIGIVLLGRVASVALPITALRRFMDIERGTIRLLTWGGLRGGLSIAMALSLPVAPEKSIIVPVTYIVVIFSILVQGLSFPRLLARLTVPKP